MHDEVPGIILDQSPRFYSPTRLAVRRGLKTTINSVLYLFCASYLFIFLWLLINSFKDRVAFGKSAFGLPDKLFFGNYTSLTKGNEFFIAAFNSIFTTGVCMFGVVVLSFIIAYFLSRYSFRGRNFLYGFFLLGMLIPLHSLLIPAYIQFNALGITNTRLTLLIPYITFNLPVAIYLYDSYMRTIPRAVEEAAFIDGASMNTIMTRVMFPICVPITGTVMILDFMGIWNEFSFALVLTNKVQFRTIPIWLATFQGQYSSNIPGRLTAMLIACLPIIVVYIFFKDKMMEGMTAGAVKG